MLLFPFLDSISAGPSNPVYQCGLLSWTEAGNRVYSVLSSIFQESNKSRATVRLVSCGVFVQHRKWSPTANDPQIGPQMIPNRKWSPMWTANDPAGKRVMIQWHNIKVPNLQFKIVSYNSDDCTFFHSSIGIKETFANIGKLREIMEKILKHPEQCGLFTS